MEVLQVGEIGTLCRLLGGWQNLLDCRHVDERCAKGMPNRATAADDRHAASEAASTCCSACFLVSIERGGTDRV
jgi:hypothetical protein